MRCAFLGNNVTPSSAFPATAPNLVRKNSATAGRLDLLSPWPQQLPLAGPSGRSQNANIVAFSAGSYPEKPLPNAYSTVLGGAKKSQARSDSAGATVPAKTEGKNLGLLRQMLELVGLFPSTSWHTSATVHPTAAVDPRATLGEGVYVGPHTTIGPHVKLGEGCYVGPGVYIAGDTHIGPGCVLQSGAVVGSEASLPDPQQNPKARLLPQARHINHCP
ncbi:hypothetical protein CYMTET_21788 [Cymbomonas tetramitiformis]|uniref:Mannose-1-phosphate guanylyltransferase n=1 Tax=Cymbomonas tetramitiformis TaxID=36881 RepID=A0AAE0G2N8_9CHLO|nr:hypothetical protein CYMTET_21788 [Cymbomonas tetramitiformis]